MFDTQAGAHHLPPSLGRTFSCAVILDENSFSVPADFELGKVHQATITGPGGGNFSFCVTRTGAVAATSACSTGATQTPIARTGSDYIDDGLRLAAVTIGPGAMLLLWRCRSSGAAPSATPAA